MDRSLYITTDVLFPIIQAIPQSQSTDTVTISILRLSDNYTWNFTTLAFVSGSVSGSMSYLTGILWQNSFTPDKDDTYIVTINDVTLDQPYVLYLTSVAKVTQPVTPPLSPEIVASQLSICNLALSHIAQRPITDIDDTNCVQSVVCKRMWDIARREALRGHDWGFATTPVLLVEATDYTPLGWDYAYVYPSTAVAVWHVYNEGTKDRTVGEQFRELYDPVGDRKIIVTNCDTAYAEVTYNVTNPLLFDANFVTAFGYRLAADLTMPLVGDAQLNAAMIDGFNKAINDAERMSSYEQNDDTKPTSSFIDSRV